MANSSCEIFSSPWVRIGHEVQVRRDEDGALPPCDVKNLEVRRRWQEELRDPGNLMTFGSEGADAERRDVHVRQIAHRLSGVGCRQRAGLFAGQPGGVFRGLTEVLGFQFGVRLKDVGSGHPGGELLHHESDRDPQAADGRLTLADGRVHADAIEFHGDFSPSVASRGYL